MAVRRSLNQIKHQLESQLLKSGEYFTERIAADLGDHDGVVKVSGTSNMVYARLTNGQVIQVFNDKAPAIYNWKVFIGRDKSQPGLLKVLEVRWVYNVAQTVAYVMFHHAQHEYPAPDTIWIRRDQFMPLLVLPNGGLHVRLYGDVIYTPGMTTPLKINNSADIDLSSHAMATGAKYVLIEIATDGTLNYITGSTYGSIDLLRANAPIPTPTEGSFPICAIEFYEGQTEIRRDSTVRNIVDLRMFTSNATLTAGSQIHAATADTPLDADEFGFWDVVDSALKKITWANIITALQAIFFRRDGTVTATGNWDLDGNWVSNVDAINFELTPDATIAEGQLRWAVDDETLEAGLHNGVVLQIGQEQLILVKNQTGAVLTDGKVVVYDGAVGISGRMKAKYGIADGTMSPKLFLGVVTETIPNGDDGFVTVFGKVRGISTDGSAYSETWVDGDVLWASPTVVGGFTNVEPDPPNLRLPIAVVITAHATTGTIFVRMTNGLYLNELHDVDATSPSDGDVLTYDGVNFIWKSAASSGGLPSPFAITTDITPPTLADENNDYNPTGLATADILRLEGVTPRSTITGIAGGADGRILILYNIGSTYAIYLSHENILSSAANRFHLDVDGGVGLISGSSAIIQYDATISRWRLLSTSVATNLQGASIQSNLSENLTDDFPLVWDSFLGEFSNAALSEAGITLSDLTTLNVSTSKHGLVPKAPNDTAQFLRGDAAWSNTITDLTTLGHFQDINRFGFIASYDGTTGTTISFDPVTYTFTLTDSGSGWGYYFDGVAYKFTGNRTIVLSGTPPSKATYYITFDDGTGVLKQSTTVWSLEGAKVPVAMILWDNALTPKYWMGEERHTSSMDRRVHLYLHTNLGSRWNSGGIPSGYTVAPVSPANANNTFGISEASLYDEDIKNTLAALVDPDGTTNSYVIMYKSGGNWVWEYSTMPYRFTAAGYIQYDSSGTMTQGTSAKYYNTYLIITNFKEASAGVGSFQIIHGKQEFASLATAQAEDPTTFDFTGFPLVECVIGWQLTWQTSNAYTTNGECRLAATPKRIGNAITSSIVPVAGTTAGSVTTDTTNFNSLLSTADTDVQKALDTLDNHTHTAIETSISSGWILVSATWTRTGNYTFTISGDVTATYRKGVKVRYKDGGAYEYGVVGSSSYGAPNTTVTLITNTDYAMAAATITDRYISLEENPEGFPTFFNYTTTVTAGSGSITTYTVNICKWNVIRGRLEVLYDIKIDNNGTGAVRLQMTTPIAALALLTGTFRNITSAKTGSISGGASATTVGMVLYDATYPVATGDTVRGFYIQDY